MPSGASIWSPHGTILRPSVPGAPEKYERIDVEVPLFSYRFWVTNGPRSMSLACHTEADSVSTTFVSRRRGDIGGIYWAAEDYVEHELLKRQDFFDYTGVTWTFSVELEGDLADIDDEVLGLIMSVEHVSGHWQYVRLALYADELAAREGKFTINFDNLQAGFFGEEPVDPTAIKRLLIPIRAVSFEDGNTLPLDPPEAGTLTLKEFEVNTAIKTGVPDVPPHRYGMCTSYDDMYFLTPERVVECCHLLGYRGRINHYCGMSHYYDQIWNEGEGRFNVVTSGDVSANYTLINRATAEWHKSFCRFAAVNDMSVIMSISYELFSEVCPFEWAQRDWDDNFGVTGYEPPSYLLSPCIVDGMQWLKDVFIEFANILDDANLPIWMQVGEPWWWWNTADRRPCFYDFPTRLKFNAETGLFAPEFPTIDDIQLTGTPYDEFKEFLQKELGQSVIDIKDHVVAAYPGAYVTPLIFLPSILDEKVGIIRDVNFPRQQWSYPEFKFIQTEAYDWLVNEDTALALKSFYLANESMGYPPHTVHYLAGFVPDNFLGKLIDPNYELDVDGPEVWRRILGSMVAADLYNVGKSYVWAFPQVLRDSVTFFGPSTAEWAVVMGEVVQADTTYSDARREDRGIRYPSAGPALGESDIPDPEP